MAPAAFDAHGTLGALSVGVLISCFLFGIVTVQAYIYYTRFPEDQFKWKFLVTFVWFFELAHCISICHSLYYLTINQYGNPKALIKPPHTLFLAIVFSGVIGPVVQAFFAERVRVVSGKLIIPIICWTLSAVRLGMSAAAAGEAFQMTSLSSFQKEFKWLLTTVLAVGCAVDVLVAGALCYYLNQQKSNSHERTAIMIDKIIAWTVQTGLMTSLTGLVMLIFFVAMPGNFIWLCFFMFLARMFSNSLLASLNARTILRQTNFVELQHPSQGSATYASNTRYHPSQTVSVRMTKLTEVTGDSKGDITDAV
ncbi:hypothetical protein B0H34DRAFT_802933 [Crassisporium funariophilum]|nr:hypothetical protein B0H34DRAFT_802933 [Crassisporium funariophilum]